ncbi:ABC transporter ATP-binding protein [Alkalihalobacillus pseudalcaliphilus]|uniref:ABC transporter ATP-binding protein n=1 Tax=Alkalihalobacillus pseudalcaliphilus TaxID=79884 RepID=UPI00064D9F39|nr:ABC transporter ATP-binding protein [Alkalihalobacillus pseudalcaliphilus]KMK77830.1 peptide ABC transporter ATP-binding protein [Alkalihalobacillus pseudalcaliphilus]
MSNDYILDVKGLRTSFFTGDGEVKAVDGVDFAIERGKTLGIVGESGSGKSITSLSVLRLIQEPQGKVVDGEIHFKGENLLDKTKKEMRKIRGNHISMIFQEPMTSLNPTLTCGEQIAESIRIHQKLKKKPAWDKAVEMLKLVGIPSPEKRAKQYPFELSGGMRQRVMIAISLACNPELLIADEPTTALDVTIQAQILELIKNLQSELGTSLMMITHDLGVVAEMCDKVAVMYCGKIVEYADVKTIFTNPKHPYTIGLLDSIPKHDEDVEGDLAIIPGSVPSPFQLPEGCRFAPRCPHAREICALNLPELTKTEKDESVRCWMYTDEWDRQREGVNTHE